MALAGAAKACTFVTIGGSSGTVIGSNVSRRELTIVNDHATQVAYLGLNIGDGSTVSTAVLNSGIRLSAAGGSWTTNAYKGPVSAIATGAGTVLTVVDI